MDLDVDKEKGQKEESCPSKRTKANLKRKAESSNQEVQDLKKLAQEINTLENEIAKSIKSLG